MKPSHCEDISLVLGVADRSKIVPILQYMCFEVGRGGFAANQNLRNPPSAFVNSYIFGNVKFIQVVYTGI